jgi:hypothetical protein
VDFNLGGLGGYVKESILQLCPIIASVNWKRRANDDLDGSNPFTQFLIRTTVSIVIAAIIGVGSGMFSAYIMIQTMQVKLDNISYIQTNFMNRQDRFEDRINNHLEHHK